MKEKEMKEERKEIGRKGEMGGEDRGRGGGREEKHQRSPCTYS